MLQKLSTVIFSISAIASTNSCKQRNWNSLWTQKTGSETQMQNTAANRHIGEDICGKLAPGKKIFDKTIPAVEIRIRDAYTPLSLVQLERRYYFADTLPELRHEEAQANKNGCCQTLPLPQQKSKLSAEKREKLKTALQNLAIVKDFHCRNDQSILEAISKRKCTSQDAYTVLIADNKIFVEKGSCLPPETYAEVGSFESILKLL